MRFFLISIFVLLLFLPSYAVFAQSDVDKINDAILHAETYYWLGLAEDGEMASFKKGIECLDKATSLLRNEEIPNLTVEKRKLILRETKALHDDLEQQLEMAHDTLGGVFPLVRLLGKSLFVDAGAGGSYELIDDADVVAVGNASTLLTQPIFQYDQVDVVFNSVPRNVPLENEVLYIFNKEPKFFVHDQKDIETVLTANQKALFHSKEYSSEISRLFFDAWNIDNLLIVTLKKIDSVDGVFFFITEGRLIHRDSPHVVGSLSSMGFSRDRTGQLGTIVFLNIFLLISAFLGFYLIQGRRKSFLNAPKFQYILYAASLGFVIGRVSPWILLQVWGSLQPPLETLAKLSFWWPAGVGILLFLGPPLLLKTLSGRLQSISALSADGQGGALFWSLGMGLGAYLAGPLFTYSEGGAIWIYIPTVITGGLISYLVGRKLDRNDELNNISYLFFVVVASLLLGFSICGLFSSLAWLALLIIVALLLHNSYGTLLLQTEPNNLALNQSKASEDIKTVEDLIAAVARPGYEKFEAFFTAQQNLQTFKESQKHVVIGLVGEAGYGKTATAKALIRDLLDSNSGKLTVLSGVCEDNLDQGAAFTVFHQVLGECIDVEIFRQSSASDVDHQEESLLDVVIDSFIPMANLIPQGEPGLNTAKNKDELFDTIFRSLARFARTTKVLIFIDDLQWIDGSSRDLLIFLLKKFSEDLDLPIAVILASRDLNSLAQCDCGEHITEIVDLLPEQKEMILINQLGIESWSANKIVGLVGESKVLGGLFWMFQIVGELARNGHFEHLASGMKLSSDAAENSDMIISDELDTLVQKRLAEFPEICRLLRCAACIGMSFCASTISEVLSMSRLQTLELLEKAEQDTGLVIDDRKNDDSFLFPSTIILSILREKFSIIGSRSTARNVPQIIRELHGKIGLSLEKSLAVDSNPYELADHYYVAGKLYADKAAHFSLLAAKLACWQFDYLLSQSYMTMARESASILGIEATIEEDLLLVECDVNHLRGDSVGILEVAEKGYFYLSSNPDASIALVIAVARSCYEAIGSARDEAQRTVWRDRTVNLGKHIVAESLESHIVAEGYHFVALGQNFSLNRDLVIENLRKALNLVENEPESNLQAKAVEARVLNSLAEQLSYVCNVAAKKEAKRFFEKSIKIKNRPELKDLPGLARSHGGAGRLALEDNKDIDSAIYHFLEDLTLSERVGDIRGQVMMHSSLGDCYLEKGDLRSATSHYTQSYEMATGSVDKFLFAATGWLKSLVGSDKELKMAVKIVFTDYQEICGKGEVIVPKSLPPFLKSKWQDFIVLIRGMDFDHAQKLLELIEG